MPSKMGWIAIIVATGVVTLAGLLGFEYYNGGNAARLAQRIAQDKHDKEVRDRDAKIAKTIPAGGTALDIFLLSHTSKQ